MSPAQNLSTSVLQHQNSLQSNNEEEEEENESDNEDIYVDAISDYDHDLINNHHHHYHYHALQPVTCSNSGTTASNDKDRHDYQLVANEHDNAGKLLQLQEEGKRLLMNTQKTTAARYYNQPKVSASCFALISNL